MIGRDIKTESDILHLNVTSMWVPFNVLCAIASGILAYNATLSKNFISSLLVYTNLCSSAEEFNLGANSILEPKSPCSMRDLHVEALYSSDSYDNDAGTMVAQASPAIEARRPAGRSACTLC